jgi:5S rRNA maturation endonuclease (ribonuclease M5)
MNNSIRETRDMSTKDAKLKAIINLLAFLKKLDEIIDAVIVEGVRDVKALSHLGFRGLIEVCSRVGVSNGDLVEDLAWRYRRILILTDFDEEGRKLNKKLSRLLERKGVKVEKYMRRAISKLMATLGAYTIEELDNRIINDYPDVIES